RKPTASASSSPGVRIVTASDSPSTRISSGSSTATSSRAPARSLPRTRSISARDTCLSKAASTCTWWPIAMWLARAGAEVASPAVLGRVGRALFAPVVATALVAAIASAPAGARIRRAVDILPPGQSGYVSLSGLPNGTGSPHLQDQTPLFLKHRFKPDLFGLPAESTESPRSGVTIRRDRFGVPDVRGKTPYDVWFGAGYA